MKQLCFVVFLIAAIVGYSLRPLAQAMATCGQGIVIRNDTTVVIDKWMTYTAPTQPQNPTLAPTMPFGTPAPAKVIFGESLPDGLRVGIETATGTVYVPLSAVRKLAQK